MCFTASTIGIHNIDSFKALSEYSSIAHKITICNEYSFFDSFSNEETYIIKKKFKARLKSIEPDVFDEANDFSSESLAIWSSMTKGNYDSLIQNFSGRLPSELQKWL